ncbi:hypothetical protein PsYK624_129530 [Phanerochaete sordida]|uniref:Uncharacterized protein n=1 Tax=Phanerochaete sordida TaxID=48140 RepID=A0A9P3LK05_9APHY|nr:hypothetical protein PsYK624_129530 [Phanerochaete sordida]
MRRANSPALATPTCLCPPQSNLVGPKLLFDEGFKLFPCWRYARLPGCYERRGSILTPNDDDNDDLPVFGPESRSLRTVGDLG